MDGKVNWLDVPDDVIASITDKFVLVRDYIRFGAVCRSWRSIYTGYVDRGCQLWRLPLLMVPPTNDTEEDDGQTRSLYSISDNAVIPNIKLHVPHHRLCRGSSEGWLVTQRHINRDEICLLHPFSGAEIDLPRSGDLDYGDIFYEGFVDKSILSANPSSNPNYDVVMVIFGESFNLALFKDGDPTWYPLDYSFKCMHDIIYWRDRFYAVDFFGKVYACDPNHPYAQIVVVANPPEEYIHVGKKKKYLVVDCDGDLLLIVRSREINSDINSYRTSSFEVFKLKEGSSPTTSTWTRLHSLGGQALFLGGNSSLSFLASVFPGCRPDCIYFTDYDDFEWYCLPRNEANEIKLWNIDIGLCNLADGTFEQHFPLKSSFLFPNPIWIQQRLPLQQHSNN